MRHFIHRYRKTGDTYGIAFCPQGAKVYIKGGAIDVFMEGNFSSSDFDLIVDKFLALADEIDRAFKKLEEEDIDY
jgi:hypothetical protein